MKELSFSHGYIGFNCESGPTADVRVRQALAYSFHIDEYLKSDHTDTETGEVFAVSQFYPYSQVCWVVDDAFREEMGTYPFDLGKAEALLDEAGWKKNASGVREKDGQVLELKIAAMPDNPVLATLISDSSKIKKIVFIDFFLPFFPSPRVYICLLYTSLTANRQGLSSVNTENGYLRAGIAHTMPLNQHFCCCLPLCRGCLPRWKGFTGSTAP